MASTIFDFTSLFYRDLEDFEMAIHYQQEGISYAKANKLTANTISHLISIGHIHFDLDNIDEAKESYFEAKKLSEEQALDYISGRLYSYLGELYNNQRDQNESIYFYLQALLKFYNINNINGLAVTHKNIGKAYFDNRDIDLAKKNYKLSRQFYKELDKVVEKGELFYLISELYLFENQLNKSEFQIRKAIAIWETSNHLIPLNKAYLLYGQIKNKQGEFSHANEYFNQYIKFSDSNYKLETERKVAELSGIFKSEQKERKIVEQEEEIKEVASQKLLVQSKLDHSKQRNRLITIILVISLVLFVAIFVIIRTRNKQEQLKKKQREIELQQTLLRSQMNPHFIFNAMSVIQSYIYDEDTANSSKFLIHFSKLMRLILENNTKEFIGLDKEMEIINRYLVIQKMRFENRFNFIIEDNINQDHTQVSVPPMFVQPFIENAIEHGDLDKVENGLIRIHCEIQEDLFIFTVEVEDNGIGRKAASQKKKFADSENHRSMAIELTQKRIYLLNEKYKSKGFLRIENLDKETETGTGTKITITTPFIKDY